MFVSHSNLSIAAYDILAIYKLTDWSVRFIINQYLGEYYEQIQKFSTDFVEEARIEGEASGKTIRK